jgi:hypothetical protein
MHGALNDPHFVLLVLSCAAVITIGSIVTALSRVPRAEFARLQNELKELSEQVRALEVAEQRRVLRDSQRGDAAAAYVNGSRRLNAGDALA